MRSALLCLLVACGGTQIQERKAADMSKLGPATLEATKPKEGEPRDAKVRVWVDAGVRAIPNWKEDITEQIDYAGQLLVPLLGVRLKVEAFKDWNRTGDPSTALQELATTDDGKEAIWVIGYVTPGDTASKAMAELGQAQLLGKHVIIRGWAEKPETDALAASLPDLKPAERNEVLAAHKRHKQSVVLLHMLARTLGAIGENDPAWIANPAYSPKQASFADRTRDLMQTAIDRKLSDETTPSIAKELLEKIMKEDWGGWVAGDKDDIAKQLTAMVSAERAGQAASEVPMAALEQFERVKTIAARAAATMRSQKEADRTRGVSDYAAALAELDNLLVAYPGNGTIYMLKCELLLAPRPAADPKAPAVGGPKDKTARAACTRVGELSPGDPGPHFAVATAFVQTGDVAGARAELALAATKIEGLKTGAPAQWKKLIGFYSQLGSLTWTEDVLAKAQLDGADKIAAEIRSTRARYGVPKGAKFVKPEDEAALVGAVREGLSLVYANKFAAAEKHVAAGERKWPGAPGFAAVRCDLALRQTNLAGARAACSKALAADPNQSWALYLSGVIALKDTGATGTKAGIDKLKAAIAVDPELGQAWRTLAKAYQRAKDKPALEQLAKEYAAKFGSPLPQ
jgi:tetratricopeptide (TPR) repeat protein